MKALTTTIEQVLREAIQSECVTQAYYKKLSERAASEEARKKLIDLSEIQMVHRAKLERRYKELVGAPAPVPEPVSLELPIDLWDIDVSRALKIALEHERESESNFRFLAERVPNTELGNLFLELAEIEWQHKVDIQQEYNATQDPEQFLLDI